MKLREQIQRNMLAIISLVVAIVALSYNTYRNELTEENRNMRRAGFELLRELNGLQLLIDYAHFQKNTRKGNPITGWGHVMYIKDMSQLLTEPVVVDAEQLVVVWGDEWQAVRDNTGSSDRVTGAINQLRDTVRDTMQDFR